MVDERATLHREMLDPDDYFRHSHSHYQRLQFRRMYRYGLALLLVGALCNWIGFAQHSFAPIRYLGVGCVLAGALCICIALCRWLAIRHTDVSQPQDITCGGAPSIHVITIPIQSREFRHTGEDPSGRSKPPDYESVAGSKPPSYDEAIRITPAPFLHSGAATPPPYHSDPSTGQSTCSYIDCSRCSEL